MTCLLSLPHCHCWHHSMTEKMSEEKDAVIKWVLAQCDSSRVLPSSQPEIAHLKLAFLPGTGERQSAALCRAFAKAASILLLRLAQSQKLSIALRC